MSHCITYCYTVKEHPVSWGLEKCKLSCMPEDVAKGLTSHEWAPFEASKHSNNEESPYSD